jgi:hypothetical protein
MAEFFDEETEDLGWSQMSALLDREMPVAKRRRRRPILWWSLLGIGLLASGLFYYQQKDAKTTVLVVQKPIAGTKLNGGNVSDTFEVSDTSSASKLLLSKTSQSKISDNLANNNLQQSEKTFAQPSKPNLLPNFSVKTPPQYSSHFLVKKTVSNSNEVVKNEQTTLNKTEGLSPNADNLIVANSLQNAQNTSPQYPNVSAAQPNLIVEKPKSQHDLLPPLPLNQAQALEIREKSAFILEKTPVSAKILPTKIHQWHFGITAGMHTEGEKWLQNSSDLSFVDANAINPAQIANDPAVMPDQLSKGFSAGFVVKYDVTSRWSLQSGLNYRHIDLGSRQFGYWQVNQDSVNNAYKSTGLGTTANFNTVKSDFLRLSRLVYLEMPIAAHYRFARKWSVGLGLKASYLLRGESELIRANAATYILPVNVSSRSFSADKFANYDVTARTSIGELQTKMWDVAAIASLHFSPRRWDFSLRYDFGTLNVLKYQNSKDYNRFIGLNVAYFFR